MPSGTSDIPKRLRLIVEARYTCARYATDEAIDVVNTDGPPSFVAVGGSCGYVTHIAEHLLQAMTPFEPQCLWQRIAAARNFRHERPALSGRLRGRQDPPFLRCNFCCHREAQPGAQHRIHALFNRLKGHPTDLQTRTQ
jgi:hypothetical protein